MTARETRIARFKERVAKKHDESFGILEHLKSLENLPEPSEVRFHKLPRRAALSAFAEAISSFQSANQLVVRKWKPGEELPQLQNCIYFKYSQSYREYCERIRTDENTAVFTVTSEDVVLAYGLVQSRAEKGLEVEIIDVEVVSRRSNGLQATVQLEEETFGIGVGHVLVFAIAASYSSRIYTDATNSGSQYIFATIGFLQYGGTNPCLMERASL